MKRIRINESFKRKVRSAARNNGGRVIVQSVKTPSKPGVDQDVAKQAAKRFLGSALFNKAVSAFDRLILERCYTFEGLLEVVETWRSHGMNERQIWIQLWILYTRKKSMKFQPRLDTDPRQELLKYYDPKSVHSIMYEFERCKDTWKQRAARRRRERKERMERERLARINTDSALPCATNTTRSRPSTAA